MLSHTPFLMMPLIAALLIAPSRFGPSPSLENADGRNDVSTVCQGTTFPCDVSISITDVEYTGQTPANDHFKVKLQLTSPSPCFATLPTQSLTGPPSLFTADFSLSLKVTRHLGHTDTGFTSFNRSITGPTEVAVKVPRGTLETDPVTAEVNVEMSATLRSAISARVAGSGIPSLNGAPSSPSSGNTAQCYPSVTITSVNFVQGAGAQKDTVTLNWTVVQPQSSCLKLTNVTATAKLTRADGSIGTATSGGNGSATLQVSGNPGNVVAFDVSVLAQAASSPSIKASAKKIKNI